MNSHDIGSTILRVGLALVFFWFGVQQLIDPSAWTGFVPSFASSIIPAGILVALNGLMELSLGALLLFGVYTRFAAVILGLHMLGIAASIGWSPIGIRDFGLAISTIAIAFLEPDAFSLDTYFEKKK